MFLLCLHNISVTSGFEEYSILIMSYAELTKGPKKTQGFFCPLIPFLRSPKASIGDSPQTCPEQGLPCMPSVALAKGGAMPNGSKDLFGGQLKSKPCHRQGFPYCLALGFTQGFLSFFPTPRVGGQSSCDEGVFLSRITQISRSPLRTSL